MENKIKIFQEVNNNLSLDKVHSQLEHILEGQEINQDEMRQGFITLAQRNLKLSKVNEQLTQQLGTVVAELNQMKEEREDKAARKEARATRKRLPKRDQMTAEIYQELILAAEGPGYIKLRLRVALCILAVTGIRINELLPLKVQQLQTLTQEFWIAIDRSKGGPINHKAFLTKEGKKILQDRKKDFDLLFLIKELDSYVFTSETDHSQMLTRETITRDVNRLMRRVSKELPGQPNFTSHSFRIGYITQLWKDTKDIEFVKQTIGHRKLDTTSAYVNKLSDHADHERQKRIDQLE